MYFSGTEMHMVTFFIIMFELVMLLFQIVYFLERPSDKKRLWYLILLLLLLLYNICGGFLPDKNIPIPITLQTIIAYLTGFSMSAYVVYYFFKVFELNYPKPFVTHGLLIFLFGPFVFCFVMPYLLTGNLEISRRLTVIIPFFYGVAFIYITTTTLITKIKEYRVHKNSPDQALHQHAIAAYISMLCWAALPVITWFGDFQVLEHSVTNAGFLMMTIIYIRSSINQSRKEYNKLVRSEKNLQELNNQLKEKVKERTKKLEQLYEQRTNTFINLAHETKTPITLINNYLEEFIEERGETPEVNVIKSNIQRLTADIINFFDIERFHKGFEIYDHNQICNFSSMLNSKIVLFKSFANKKKITLTENIGTDIFIKAHPGAIERITNNLIENAIKYTPQNGQITVSLLAEENRISFSVADNGRGIPKHLQKKVFEPYFQLSNDRKTNEGMGLGLAIVKKIVDSIGCGITLKSCELHGTVVTIFLNRHIPDESIPILEYKGSKNLNLHTTPIEIEDAVDNPGHPFVLIVEDNLYMLSYLRKKLKEKYNVYVAKNGGEALQKIKLIGDLDIIISDVMMDTVDGFEFCSSLSKNERYEHIPLIFLTARTTMEDRMKGLRLGAIDYVEKPFLIHHLLYKIEAILTNSKKQKVAFAKKISNVITTSKEASTLMATTKVEDFESTCKRYGLTNREIEISVWLCKGKPYKAIADVLNISNKTVNTHITNIFSKLGVTNKVELINKLNISFGRTFMKEHSTGTPINDNVTLNL